MPSCQCHAVAYSTKSPALVPVRSATAGMLGLVVAFFPKCPMCWAAYSSWLGLAGVYQIPYKYMGYLFPIIVGLLAVHLVLLSKHVKQVGWGPLLTSLLGAVAIIVARHFAADCHWALNTGITFMLVGSLWNTFAVRRRYEPS